MANPYPPPSFPSVPPLKPPMSTGKKTALIIGAVILFCCCGGGTPFVFWNPFHINLGATRHHERSSPTHDSGARIVRMEVSGTTPTASVNWVLPSFDHGEEEAALPWSKTVNATTSGGPLA